MIGSTTENWKKVKAHQVGGCPGVCASTLQCICVRWLSWFLNSSFLSVFIFCAHTHTHRATYQLMAVNCWSGSGVCMKVKCESAQTSHMFHFLLLCCLTVCGGFPDVTDDYIILSQEELQTIHSLPQIFGLQESCIWWSPSHPHLIFFDFSSALKTRISRITDLLTAPSTSQATPSRLKSTILCDCDYFFAAKLIIKFWRNIFLAWMERFI